MAGGDVKYDPIDVIVPEAASCSSCFFWRAYRSTVIASLICDDGGRLSEVDMRTYSVLPSRGRHTCHGPG